MGDKVSSLELAKRAHAFFDDVVILLKERNIVRGDSYLEATHEDLIGIMRDKLGRILTGMKQDLTNPAVRAEIEDSFTDIAGYSALLSIWWKEKHGDSSD